MTPPTTVIPMLSTPLASEPTTDLAPADLGTGDRVLLATTRFGELEVDPSTTFTLPDGIPGFGDLTALVMLPVDSDAMFVWLQAVSDGSLAFLAVNPWPFFADYDIEIGDDHLASLGITDVADMVVFCLARPDRDRRAFHVNLLAPLVFGLELRRARQITLDGDHPVDAALQIPDESIPTVPRVRSAGCDGTDTIEGAAR